MKKLKRSFAMLLTIVLCLSAFGVNASAAVTDSLSLVKYTGVTVPGLVCT